MFINVDIRVTGTVQGVGFRPFVYARAVARGVFGSVRNDTEGVLVHAEGPAAAIDALVRDIGEDPPPLSLVRSITVVDAAHQGCTRFVVDDSVVSSRRSTFLPPDTMVCDHCRNEFFDPADRRFQYPFITCTHCGPRFSIIDDIPYDRENTAMRYFPMCTACEQEYRDPANRRFHTEPNACPDCGPHIALFGNDGFPITTDINAVITQTLAHLEAGRVVAIKGVGGYLLAVDARNDSAVRLLRERKARPFKPFAVMAASIAAVREFAEISPVEERLLLSRERPIVLVRETRALVSRQVAPGVRHQGVMLPYMPFQHLLFSIKPDLFLVMTSGNVADEPIIFRDFEAFDRLGHIADFFVSYNRLIAGPSDDSVMFVQNETPFFVRRSRGFVPAPIYTRRTSRHILATGGDLKNSFALAKEDYIIVSQYLGDLATADGDIRYREMIDHYRQVYDFQPTLVVSDAHPGYRTSGFADGLESGGMQRMRVQHHHAHIAAVLEDHDFDGPVIGIAFDGTGYGEDGTLWGSEFLIADRANYKRAAHFSYFGLPGGERAIHDVWKIGLSLLVHAGLDISRFHDKKQMPLVIEIINKKIHTPLTCSIGRIFDGIAAILGLCDSVTSEGEAAIVLEEAAAGGAGTGLSFEVPVNSGETLVPDTAALVCQIVAAIDRGSTTGEIARAFHESLASVAVEVCEGLREREGLSAVALGGGVFQNRLLLGLITNRLSEKGFDILMPRSLPFNDGCLAVGQIAIAREVGRKKI